MIKEFLYLILILLLIGCKKQTELEKYLDCKSSDIKLEVVEQDSKSKYSIKIPKNWNVNLFEDEIQSSIFIADTTKELSNTYSLDINLVNQKLKIDDEFILQQEIDQLLTRLVKIKMIKEKDYIVFYYRGQKNNLPFQSMHQFIPKEENFIHIKVDVYGVENIKERFCDAQKIIETITYLKE